MQPHPILSSPRTQRGASALIVTMLLLFTSSIVIFYLNRGLIFEQKTSANQVRSTTAFEVAEAGLEWATGMLNRPYDITTDCSPLGTTNVSFRSKYIQLGGSGSVSPTSDTFPGCKIDGTSLTCSCPNLALGGNEAVASLGTTVLPSFTVAFEEVSDAQAVRVTATGCTAQAGACKPLTTTAATTGNSDAWAQVSAILKLRPLLRAAPQAALTCGTSCNPSTSYNIINTDLASNGYLVNAGTTITTGNGNSITLQTIPGQPVQNALVANDASLLAISSSDPTCSNSAMFKTYFGVTMLEYAASPQVMSISCSDTSGCGSALNAALTAGWKNFYFPIGLKLSGNNTFGAPGAGNGVNLVSPGDIDINGTSTIYGLLFSNSATFQDLGTGNSTINGAIVTCAGQSSTGNGTITYDANALGGNGLKPGVMVRVPGSWRDFTP
ncbi:MAG TPA: pilus assembly PilX N-terminal domain-containing protein, partial [Acidiferrobacterales bacterium]|nr:pilus assembly PilX N-terminal domain-containing protein [Acidiferrobacterales bacterium]